MPEFLVKPYLVFPPARYQYPIYLWAAQEAMDAVQRWYEQVLGATFAMEPVTIKTALSYYVWNPSEQNTPKILNEAIHGGAEQWEPNTVAFIFAAGMGAFAGARQDEGYRGWAIVGDAVLEPLSGTVNQWANSDWKRGFASYVLERGNAFGTVAHELGHAFGIVQHDGHLESIMTRTRFWPNCVFIPEHRDFLLASPFFQHPVAPVSLENPEDDPLSWEIDGRPTPV